MRDVLHTLRFLRPVGAIQQSHIFHSLLITFAAVATSEEAEFCHRIEVELIEVEELPPVWESQEVRLKMSTRFKSEGNEKFAAGDYKR